jgi:hypothetical protein
MRVFDCLAVDDFQGLRRPLYRAVIVDMQPNFLEGGEIHVKSIIWD